MNLTSKILGLALGAMASVIPASAQDSKAFHVGLNVTYANDGLYNITHKYDGFGAELGYTGKLANTAVPFRTTLSFQNFAGEKFDTQKQSLTGVQLAGDLLINTGADRLRIITGISVNQWNLKYDPSLPPGTKDPAKGTKFGARLGLDYGFSDSWSGSFMIQVTELGTTPGATTGVNPSWLQAGLKYHF